MALALIPARGGSKGIPRKNLAEVAGKPLIQWTIEAAQGASSIDRVVVSTDDDEIAAAVGVEVLRRPAELAQDDTPMAAVVRHAVDELAPDVVVLLQPTSPLRTARHIDEAVAALGDADAVVSVVRVPHNFEPGSLLELDGTHVRRLGASTPLRQAKPELYARNGPAVLVLRASSVGADLCAGDVVAYVMDARASLDVDTPFDLELASLLLS